MEQSPRSRKAAAAGGAGEGKGLRARAGGGAGAEAAEEPGLAGRGRAGAASWVPALSGWESPAS